MLIKGTFVSDTTDWFQGEGCTLQTLSYVAKFSCMADAYIRHLSFSNTSA